MPPDKITKYHFEHLLISTANPPPPSSSSSSDDTAKLSWINLIDESVHTSDDIDIGDIDAVNRDFVVVKKGFVNIHYYYIPITKVEGWDGHILWLKITENDVKAN